MREVNILHLEFGCSNEMRGRYEALQEAAAALRNLHRRDFNKVTFCFVSTEK